MELVYTFFLFFLWSFLYSFFYSEWLAELGEVTNSSPHHVGVPAVLVTFFHQFNGLVKMLTLLFINISQIIQEVM